MKKIPEPIKTYRDGEVQKQLIHTTLIRDQNGLGFSIAGGKGSPPFKNNSNVNLIFYYFDYYFFVSYF